MVSRRKLIQKEKLKIEDIFKEHQKFYPKHLSNFDESTFKTLKKNLRS